MIRLAFIGSLKSATAHACLANWLRGAVFCAYAPAESPDEEAATPFAGDLAANSFQALLQTHADRFDAVVLDARSDLNPALLQSATTAGKPVLINAPIAPGLALATELSHRTRQASLPIMVNQPLRHFPSVSAVKSGLDQGKLGVPGLLRIHRWHSAGDSTMPLLDRLAKEIDLATWIFGETPERLFAIASPTGTPTYFQLHLGYEKNGMAVIDWTESLPEGGDYFSWSLIGSSGAAYADDHHNMQLLFSGGSPSAVRTEPSQRHLVAPLQRFVDALTDPQVQWPPFDDGSTTLALFEAAIESAQSGRTARLRNRRHELV